MHHLAPVQLPSVNEAQSVLHAAHPLCRRLAWTLCQQSSAGVCVEGASLFTFVVGWIDEVVEAQAGAMMWMVGVLLWRKVFPPPRRLTEFDKAVSAWRRSRSSACGCTFGVWWWKVKTQRREGGGRSHNAAEVVCVSSGCIECFRNIARTKVWEGCFCVFVVCRCELYSKCNRTVSVGLSVSKIFKNFK